MARTNTLPKRQYTTNEVATVVPSIDAKKRLVRMVLANLLFEDQFYVDGQTCADTLAKLVKEAPQKFVEHLAIAARSNFNLRHVPLFLMRELARNGRLNADVLASVIQRPDELGEFVSMYWKDKKQPLSNQVKKGLAKALCKFNEYSLAKNDKNSAAVRIRDVLFLTHAKPQDAAQAELFKRIADDKLVVPDTWETQLSAGADKGETFTRLMAEKKLGALAFLRNLRNMVQAGIPESTIRAYGASVNCDRVLPFRFLAAARIVPQFEDMLEQMMFKSLEGATKLKGKTVLLVDCSGSMFGTKVSSKSDLDRFDAAASLAILMREICEEVEIFGFSTQAVRVPARRGFALVEAIRKSTSGGTAIGASYQQVTKNADRYVIFTDEQSYDKPNAPHNGAKGYLVNVASYQNGLNHADWVSISGFSEALITYIQALENEDLFLVE